VRGCPEAVAAVSPAERIGPSSPGWKREQVEADRPGVPMIVAVPLLLLAIGLLLSALVILT
jgi:hypothetical protein